MNSLAKPIYTGRISNKPLRFFRTPLQGNELPWHAWNDLQACMDLLEDMRTYLHRCLTTDWCADVRTVATADGIVTIAPHWMAQGVIAAITEATDAGPAPMIAYQTQMFAAWTVITGGMPAAASMGLLSFAVCNSIRHARSTG